MQTKLSHATITPISKDVVDISYENGGIQLRGNLAEQFLKNHSNKTASSHNQNVQQTGLDIDFQLDVNESETARAASSR